MIALTRVLAAVIHSGSHRVVCRRGRVESNRNGDNLPSDTSEGVAATRATAETDLRRLGDGGRCEDERVRIDYRCLHAVGARRSNRGCVKLVHRYAWTDWQGVFVFSAAFDDERANQCDDLCCVRNCSATIMQTGSDALHRS